MSSTTRRSFKGILVGASTAALMMAGVSSASAHVHIEPDSTAAGAPSQLAFATAHGCGASPTTKMTITLPEEINDATPTAKADWNVEKVTEQLDEPKTLDNGSKITERISQIVYTAEEPLPDGVRDTFEIEVELPDAAGETLAFPTLQTCEQGATDWSQIPEEGQDAHSLESPAPTIEVTEASAEGGSGHGAPDEGGEEASGSGTGSEAAADDDGTAQAGSEQASATSSSGNSMIGWIGLVAGLLGLAAGGTALARTRK